MNVSRSLICAERAPRLLRRGRERARVCPARLCAKRTLAGYGGDVSGHVCVPLAVRREHPAAYGGDVSGHACVPLTTRGAHPRQLHRGRERARMCPARDMQSAPRQLRRGRERARMCPARLCAVRSPAVYGGDVSGHACVPLAYAQSVHPATTAGTWAGTHVSRSLMRRAQPRRIRRGRARARMCLARICAERAPAGYGGDVSGHACVPLAYAPCATPLATAGT